MTKEQKMDLIIQLLNTNDKVIVPEITNRKETVKEMQQRLYNNHNKHKALRATKKNL